MNKCFALVLTLALCVSLCSCSMLSQLDIVSYKKLSPSDTITYSEDGSEMYYNGRTYVEYPNYNGKYRFDFKEEGWEEIAVTSTTFFYILGAYTVYYGNNVEEPVFISHTHGEFFYVREDTVFDHQTELSLYSTEQEYDFKISEVTTGNIIEYDSAEREQFTEICKFSVVFKEYPIVRMRLTISEYEGRMYLQDVYDSDFYETTDEFKENIYRLGLDALDCRIVSGGNDGDHGSLS